MTLEGGGRERGVKRDGVDGRMMEKEMVGWMERRDEEGRM